MRDKKSATRFSRLPLRMFSFFILSIFSVQSSAFAFVQGFSSSISQAPVSSFSPSKDMGMISSRSVLSNALSPIQNSSSIYSSFESSTNPVVSIYRFENRYRKIARLVFAALNPDLGYPYQSYELNASDNLGRLIETGKMIGGEFIRERIYDYKNRTVTLYDSKNAFEKRVYSLNESGEAGRPVQFSGRTSAGDLINIRFIYHGRLVICLHQRGMTYSIYSLQENDQLGDLVEMGTARGIDQKGRIQFKSRIQISELEREGQRIPVYVYRDSRGGALIRERRPALGNELGGIGRILRYMSADVDFEYFYDDSSARRTSTVKVVNHLLGQSFSFDVEKRDLKNPFGNWERQPRIRVQEWLKAVASLFYGFARELGAAIYIPVAVSHLPIYIRANDEALIWEKLLRGPPALRVNLFLAVTVNSSSLLQFFAVVYGSSELPSFVGGLS